MKNIRHIITDKEKEIISNFFLKKGLNSRQNYLKWLDVFFTDYRILKSEGSKKSVYSENYQIDMIWDASTNTSLTQHFVKHPSYHHSNSLFKNFKKFHSDFNHLDNSGNNILHDAGKYNYSFLNQILKEEKVDTTVINNDDKTYHMIVADNFNHKDLISNPKLNHICDMSNRVGLIAIILTNFNKFVDNGMQDVVDPAKLHDFINNNQQIIPAMEKMWKAEIPKIRAEAYKECIQEITDFKNQLMFLKLYFRLEEKPAMRRMKI